MNMYDIAEESYKNGYEKGYRDGKVDLLKMIKITYCANSVCPYEDCYKHLTKIKELDKEKNEYVRMADFSGVCRKYIDYLVDELMGEKEIRLYD